jgi:NADH:ubiquinone oxidoreductase subunit
MKFLDNIISVLSPLSFLLSVWRRGHFVGVDQIGNRYFRAAPRQGYKREQRWVVYKNEADASAIPPEWHGWMHHQSDVIPTAGNLSYRQDWQKPHRPNLTGSDLAYRPPGHQLSGGVRAKATGDYQPWKPE